ncbi:Translation initiation factor [Desmophyllum pertusum]|uniref:Translation initiation factor n=1 Tax=Desmophyllum pertusum TaxID=174260 RepID=A0A9W9YK39_9CNID|nr:Translation initiation factor [Desmophyllum pertusum]
MGSGLPSVQDNARQRDNYITLAERIISSNIPCLYPLCQIGDDEDRKYGEQGIVGDQLSVERAVNGHMSLANGFTPEERAEGLHFEVADWHAGNKFLDVAFTHMYNVSSAVDKCTMFSDRTLINRRNVKGDLTRIGTRTSCVQFRVLEHEQHPKEQQAMTDQHGRYPCRSPGCSKTFAHDGKLRREHEAKHNPPIVIDDPPLSMLTIDSQITEEKRDDMLAYQKSILDYGMLILKFLGMPFQKGMEGVSFVVGHFF